MEITFFHKLCRSYFIFAQFIINVNITKIGKLKPRLFTRLLEIPMLNVALIKKAEKKRNVVANNFANHVIRER